MIRRIWRAPMFSPTGLLTRAVLLTVIYLVLHLAGWRENTSILCGTAPTGNLSDRYAEVYGVIYVLFYFAVMVLVPILVIAAGMLAIVARCSKSSTLGK